MPANGRATWILIFCTTVAYTRAHPRCPHERFLASEMGERANAPEMSRLIERSEHLTALAVPGYRARHWFFGFALVLLFGTAGPGLADPNGDCSVTQIVPSAREVIRLARDRAEQEFAHRVLLRYTPLLPKIWPPRQCGPIVIFGYCTRSAPTGMRQSIVHSPQVVVTITFENSHAVVCEVERRESSELPDLQPRPVERLDDDELFTAGDALLRVVADGQAEESDPERIRSVYRRWQAENAVIASHLAEELQTFFAWLNEESG